MCAGSRPQGATSSHSEDGALQTSPPSAPGQDAALQPDLGRMLNAHFGMFV